MRSCIIAAVAALALASTADALAAGGGGGAGKSPVVVTAGARRDSASPLLFDKQHAAQRHCEAGKACPPK
jgi:hypothetical protein